MKKRLMAMFLLLALVFLPATAFAAPPFYRDVLEEEVEVTANVLNVRTGPDTAYPKVGSVKKGDKLPVLGALGNWYIVYLPDGAVGVVSTRYTKVTQMREIYPQEGDETALDIPDDTDAGTLFGLANQTRHNNGIALFAWDAKLNEIARLKAEDMKKCGYIGHYSENYGTPYEMLKNLGMSYKSAGENIAVNISVESGFAAMLGEPVQRSNILSARYNKMGVGIVDSEEYGKIIVQIFIESE